ncbi:MAG: biotin--[acetyl-CoA-carboxylase] ligase [Methanosarcinales archaeon]|nr:MAG: biotin--[acetyl-CoA-carboxylase] ligase [Methanosarcinales archaeon]
MLMNIERQRKNKSRVDSTFGMGHIFKEVPDLIPAEIQRGLNTSIIGKTIEYYREVKSTNSVAASVADNVEDGTTIITEIQTRGRGRIGRTWVSPRGGIWLSIVLKPRIPAVRAYRLTIAAGLAAAKTIRAYEIDAKIKWPNDIIIGNKKVCGILTETEAEAEQLKHAIVGIGVDTNIDTRLFPEEIRDHSTSLQTELGESIDRVEFIKRLLTSFEYEYLRLYKQFPQILDEWRYLLATTGKRVQINNPTTTIYGKAVGVDREGALIIKCDDGFIERVVAGECIHASI